MWVADSAEATQADSVVTSLASAEASPDIQAVS
jgi:hypothetical protein